MLSIGKVTPGRADYYEKSVAQGRDDYYSGKGEAPGTWVGRAAASLGLNGRVEAERFQAMIAGLDPSDPDLRRSLQATARTERTIGGRKIQPVAAYDLTFSAPKSVSVLFSLADTSTARELVAAHDAAVQAALDYIEDHVYTRRGRNGWKVECGDGLIAAAYRHRMSRSQDPQLHSHVVAANLVRSPSDGRWRALHASVIYRHARTAGVLYQAHLRAEVRDRLGLQWGPVRKGAAELEAVPLDVLREFSTRRRAIEQAAIDETFGLGSKRAAEALTLMTRSAKDHSVRTADWRADLRARAEELNFNEAAIDALLAAGRLRLGEEQTMASVAVPDDLRDDRTDESIGTGQLHEHLAGPRGVTARQNTFGERELLSALAEHHPQGLRVNAVRTEASRFLDRDDVPTVRPVESGGVSEPHWTTADLVASERRLIAAAVMRRSTGSGLMHDDVVDRGLASTDRPLTREQERVVRAIAASGNGVEVIEARAGSGKTFTAGSIRRVYEAADIKVMGVAPTGRAARELAEVGIPARTLHATMAALDRYPDHGLPRGALVILDEAGMAPTRLTGRFLAAAQQADAKVIVIGDSGQLPSVEAGGWMREVGRQVGELHLSEVHRQRDPEERRMLGLLHDAPNGGAKYIAWLDQSGRLDIDLDTAALTKRALDAWTAAVERYGLKQAVLISRDQETRQTLNARAREIRAEHGALGEGREYGSLVIAIGDRVIARRNDYDLAVDNGTRGTVTTVTDSSIEIRTDGGATRSLPASYVENHIEHAYALTGHGMQGATVDWAGIVARSEHLTRGWAYTALSRARYSTRVYVPAVDAIRRDERADLAPHDTVEKPERADTIHRITTRMLERDDEDLAVTQLIAREPRAGSLIDTELNMPNAQPLGPGSVVAQEEAARRAEPVVPPSDRDELRRLTAQIRDLERQRDPVLLGRLRRLDELVVEREHTLEQRDRAGQRLAELPEPSARRFRLRASDDPRVSATRSSINATIAATDERLRTIERDERQTRQRLSVDPEQARAEHREREAQIGALDRRRIETRDRIVHRTVAECPTWLTDEIGTRPGEPSRAATWERDAASCVRARVDAHGQVGRGRERDTTPTRGVDDP